MPARRRPGTIALSFSLLLGSASAYQEPRPPSYAAAAAAAAQLPRLHSLIVSQRGTVAVEYYARNAGRSRTANVKSVSKSVISALVGIAVDRGLLKSVNEPIGRFFPELPRDPDLRTSLAFYRGDVKVFDTPLVEKAVVDDAQRRAVVFQFQVPASQFTPGTYTCQVNIIDAVANRLAFPRLSFMVRGQAGAPTAIPPM